MRVPRLQMALVLVLLGSWLFQGCAGVRPHPEWREEPREEPEEREKLELKGEPKVSRKPLGRFAITFYCLVDEADGRFVGLPREVPIRDIYGQTIALVSQEYKRKADIEGSGKLWDGRVINYAGRAADGIRYRVVEGAQWGLGAANAERISKVEPYKLVPHRTVAVDPKKIPLGSVLFIPRARGIRLPNGTDHDGYFLAHDVGGAIKGKRLDFFVGTEEDIRNTFTENGMTNKSFVEVYLVGDAEAEEVRSKYRRQYTLTLKATYQMVWKELEAAMRNVAAAVSNLDHRMMFFSELAKGTPYVIFCLGEGPEGTYDKDPLLDIARVDCMTFCEQSLSMAISKDYQEFFQNLQRIRYRDGIIGMKTRNHYTIADWLPNNGWLLEDATEIIGGELCRPMTKTVDRAKDLAAMGCTDVHDVAPPQTITVKYIPKESLYQVEENLRGGEIVSLIQKKEGIFSSHMGLIAKDRQGETIFRHASRTAGEVVDEPYQKLVDRLLASQNNAGAIFMRIRRDVSLAMGP
jgi:3D (Asp-Asp-Asp) domain-containing protein